MMLSDLTLVYQKNKMAVNMAKIWHLNDHNKSSIGARDLLLISTMVVDVKEGNDVIRFSIGWSEKQAAGKYGGNLVFKWLYLELYVYFYLK